MSRRKQAKPRSLKHDENGEDEEAVKVRGSPSRLDKENENTVNLLTTNTETTVNEDDDDDNDDDDDEVEEEDQDEKENVFDASKDAGTPNDVVLGGIVNGSNPVDENEQITSIYDDEDDENNEAADDDDEDDGDMAEDGDDDEENDDDDDDISCSDSFYSEIYSSHTSSSFSPSISDGIATPNSITNDNILENHIANNNNNLSSNNNNEKVMSKNSKHNSISGKSKEKNVKNLDGSYHCQFCDKTFPRLGYLKKHEQSHTEQMPFKCEYCSRLFKHKRSRDRHTKLHTGDRRYKCPHCEAAFSRSDHLKIHMKTHDNQKPFQCTICNRGYNTAAALTSHMQNHKKQAALTGSPTLTYSPRSINSVSSNGSLHNHNNLKRKYSTVNETNSAPRNHHSQHNSHHFQAQQQLPQPHHPLPLTQQQQLQQQQLDYINYIKLSTKNAQNLKNNQLNASNGLLSCIYCTKSDFSSMDQLTAHINSMHSNVLRQSSEYRSASVHSSPSLTSPHLAANLSLLPVLPTANDLKNSHLQLFSCEFCTMKFPTIPIMFHHLKQIHSDRIQSPNTYLEQFNKNLLNTYDMRSSYFSNTTSYDLRKQTTADGRSSKDSIKLETKSPSKDRDSVKSKDEEKLIEKIKEENEIDVQSSRSPTEENNLDVQDSPTDLSQPKAKKLKEVSHAEKPQSQPLNNNNDENKMSLEKTPGAFLCNQCSAALPDFESFRTHLKTHLDQGASSFLCQHCGITFNDQLEYERHVVSHFLVTNSEFICSHNCNKSFQKAEDLQKHLFELHSQTLYKCSICTEIFDTKVAIQVHFAVTHANEVKIYRCSACSDVFRSEREFRHHIRTRHLTPGAVQCVFCRVICSSELEMHFHLAAHARQFRCPICPESFHVEFLLDRHLQIHHSQKELINNNNNNTTSINNNNNNSNNNNLDYHLNKNASNYFYNGGKFYNPLHIDTLISSNNTNTNNNNNSVVVKHTLFDKSPPKSHRFNDGKVNIYNHHHIYSSPPPPNNKQSSIYSPINNNNNNNNSSSNTNLNSNSNVTNNSAAGINRLGAIHANATALKNHVHPNHDMAGVEKNKIFLNDKGYSCGICERNDFSTEMELHTHRKIVHNLKTGVSLRCAYCSGDFRSRSELENHMKISHNTSGKHKCLICDEIFPSPTILAEHKLTHCKVGPSGRCSNCSTVLNDVMAFKSHLSEHNNNNNNNGNELPIQCICCRQTLNSEFEISLHAKYHTKSADTNENTCALCLETLPMQCETRICENCLKKHNFSSKLLAQNMHPNNSMNLHSNTNNSSSNNSINIGDSSKAGVIQCNLCKKYLPTIVKLEEHLIEHTFNGCEERGFICYICSSVFTSVTGLHGHMQEHGANAKPYDCNLCIQKFFFRAELDNHMIDHENFASISKTERTKTPVAEAPPKDDVEPPIVAIKCEEKDSITGSDQEKNAAAPEIGNGLQEDDDEYIEVEHSENVPKTEVEEVARHSDDE